MRSFWQVKGWCAIRLRRAAGLAVLAGLLGLIAAGCRSNDAGGMHTSSMVAVMITNANTEAIRITTIEVFLQDGYQAAYAGPNRLVFERRGGRSAEITYGSLFNQEVWIRVKVAISSVTGKGHLLECDAFIVRDKDQGHLEDEVRLYKKGPYRDLLRKVRDRVQDLQTGARAAHG